MRLFLLIFFALLAALSSAPAFADAIKPLQVTIESRFIEVSDSFFKEIGVDFDFGFHDGFAGTHDLVPLRENNQPTGDTLFSFDPDGLSPTFRLGVDIVGPGFTFLGAPSVLRIGLDGEGSFLDRSDDKGDVMIPAGQQAALVSLDGQQLTFINDPNDVQFDSQERRLRISPSIGLQTQIAPSVQLLTSAEFSYIDMKQDSTLSFMSQGNGFTDETEIESRGAGLTLSISPVVTVHDQVDLSFTASAGTVLLGSDMTRSRTDNQTTTEASDSRRVFSGVFGAGAGINVRPISGSRSSIGLAGGIRHMTNVPVLGTAFDTGLFSSIGTDSRTELLVLVTARIVLYDEND